MLLYIWRSSIHPRCFSFSARFIFTETLRMAGKMSDVEYTIIDQWYRLLNNELPEAPTGFDLSADLIGV